MMLFSILKTWIRLFFGVSFFHLSQNDWERTESLKLWVIYSTLKPSSIHVMPTFQTAVFCQIDCATRAGVSSSSFLQNSGKSMSYWRKTSLNLFSTHQHNTCKKGLSRLPEALVPWWLCAATSSWVKWLTQQGNTTRAETLEFYKQYWHWSF